MAHKLPLWPWVGAFWDSILRANHKELAMTKIVMREKPAPKPAEPKVTAPPKDTVFRDVFLGLLIGLLIVLIMFL
jgi:hypothetical protein